MLKITRFTDYALVVLCCLVKNQANTSGAKTLSANEIAKLVNLAVPTVSKVLKLLVKSDFVKSYRGIEGGYQLAKNPDDIMINQVITAMEGPVLMTACSVDNADKSACENIVNCPMSAPWQKINRAVNKILAKISLTDITYNKIDLESV